MSNVILSVKNTAENFLGSLESIDFSPITKTIESLSGELLSPSERKSATRIIESWGDNTLNRLDSRLADIEYLRDFEKNNTRSFFISSAYSRIDYFPGLVISSLEALNLFIGQLSKDIGLYDQFEKLSEKAALTKSSYIVEETVKDSKVAAHKDNLYNKRLVRNLFLQEMAFKEEFFKNNEISNLYNALKIKQTSLRKSKEKIRKLTKLASISITASSPENKKALLDLYKTLSK